MARVSRYHYYFKPDSQQIYQLSQLLVAMAVELGITKRDHQPFYNMPFDPEDLGNKPELKAREKLQPAEIEAKRAFLGCYYLSS
jgi:hypothetical protein